MRPAVLRRFLEATDLAPWRTPRRLILSADLRLWSPPGPDIGAIHLKNCDLRGVDLSGADLRRANLTRCDLRGARLAGADLSGADLEGVDLSGADLTGADLTGAFLSAARFFSDGSEAKVAGLILTDADGILEDQEAWLEERIR